MIINRICIYQELLGWLINEGDHCCWTTGDKLKVTINILLKYQTKNIYVTINKDRLSHIKATLRI